MGPALGGGDDGAERLPEMAKIWSMPIGPETADFLLSSEPWTRYRTRRDLLGEARGSDAVATDRVAMLEHPLVAQLVADVGDWPGPVIERHDKPRW